jgi:hypothetical protein
MGLRSETLGNVLKIFIWVLLILSVFDFLLTLPLFGDAENENILYFILILNLFKFIVGLINIVLFLIWIFKVHVDLNNLFPDYSRSPGHALACMMIPFYNLYGIPSTFWRIGTCFVAKSANLHREGRWIRGLAGPVLIVIWLSLILDKIDARMEEISALLWLLMSVVVIIQFWIYLMLAVQIQNGLKTAADEQVTPTGHANGTYSL